MQPWRDILLITFVFLAFGHVLGKAQYVSCNTVFPLPHKDKETWNAKVHMVNTH